MKEILWLNKNIMIANECIVYDDWYRQGCIEVHDLIDENGHFYKYEDFVQKYSIDCTRFKYMSLIDAIPKEWKAILKAHREEIITIEKSEEVSRKFGSSVKSIEKIESNDIYWKLLRNKIQKPTCIAAWNKKYSFEFSECEWKKILPRSTKRQKL